MQRQGGSGGSQATAPLTRVAATMAAMAATAMATSDGNNGTAAAASDPLCSVKILDNTVKLSSLLNVANGNALSKFWKNNTVCV